MIVRNRTPEQAREQLTAFLSSARTQTETRIFEAGDRPFTDVLAHQSTDAALSLIGLRPPKDGETQADYGAYLAHLMSDLADVPSPVYVLAADKSDLAQIFA